MAEPVKIGFAGTDARTLLSAVITSQTGWNGDQQTHRGVVIRGTPAMPRINIRPGEPEFQTVMRRLRNPGPLFEAMFKGKLYHTAPEVRENQISTTTAFVTGPGGPDGQKGYPWRVTRNN